MRPLLTRLLVVLLLAAPVVPAAQAARPAAAPATFHDAAGIHVTGVEQLDRRQLNVKVSSPALGRAVDVRILLPGDYASHPRQRYPVLYLFHGTSGRASDWVTSGDAEQTTATLPLITVMPDAGFDGDGGGWFTNWVDQTTALGPSQWETFHVDQLIPWVDANLRTIAERRGRAVAGLSQGGFGSTTYAARHPDTFVAAASFSGAPEIDRDPEIIVGATLVIEGTAMGLDGVQPDAMFGSRLTDEINWQGHDPSTLLENLRGMSLWLWTGAGTPGPYDDTPPNPGAMGIEALVHQSTQRFHQHLQEAGIPSHYLDYTDGTHSWAYWARDLREFAPAVMQVFAHPPAPASVHYTSIDKTWHQWGWSVSLDRPAQQEFSTLSDGSASGFSLAGSGTATVVTAAYYRPNSTAAVTVEGSDMSTKTLALPVDRSGRLHLTLALAAGPVHVTVQAPAG